MILCNMAAPARGSVDVAAGPSRIKLFARREGLPNWAEVTVASNESVAAAKKAIIAELGIDAKPDAITLMTEGAAVPLDDRRLVEGQLEAGDSIILKYIGAWQNESFIECILCDLSRTCWPLRWKKRH